MFGYGLYFIASASASYNKRDKDMGEPKKYGLAIQNCIFAQK